MFGDPFEEFVVSLIMDYSLCLNFPSYNRDLGCGCLLFECYTLFCNVLVLFLVFGLGLRVLQSSCHGRGLVQFLCEMRWKSGFLINGFYTSDAGELGNSKIFACKSGLLGFLTNLSPSSVDNSERKKELLNICNNVSMNESSEEKSECQEEEEELQCYPEDPEEDVIELKKMIKIERERANAAHLELEKERAAAATAAQEAMSMIFRLQNEKSSAEIQAHQYRRLAKQKQTHDHEVIQSLHWIIFRLESDRSHLQNQLKLCRQRLKIYVNSDEGDQLDGDDPTLDISPFTMEDHFGDLLISSLDVDSSQM